MITHLKLDEDFIFNASGAKDILLCRDITQIPIISVKKKRGRRVGSLVRICRQVGKPPLPSVLLAIVQSLENKLDDLRLRLSYQRDIKNEYLMFH